MTITDVFNQSVFGDVRGIIVAAAKEAGIRLDNATIEKITAATQEALRNELAQLEYQHAFGESVQQMVAKETRRFMLRCGIHPNSQVL